jgi:hypothetical protein
MNRSRGPRPPLFFPPLLRYSSSHAMARTRRRIPDSLQGSHDSFLFVSRYECSCITQEFQPPLVSMLLSGLPRYPNFSMSARHPATSRMQPASASHPHMRAHHALPMAAGTPALPVERRIVSNCFSFAGGRQESRPRDSLAGRLSLDSIMRRNRCSTALVPLLSGGHRQPSPQSQIRDLTSSIPNSRAL